MSSFKKVVGAALAMAALAAGGVAASVALASTHGSSGFTSGNCSAAAQNSAARTKALSATIAGFSDDGQGCSITINGKFKSLPKNHVADSAFVKLAPGADAGIYTGPIKTKDFTGSLTLQIATIDTITQGSGCGWGYVYQGGHWVVLYTTC